MEPVATNTDLAFYLPANLISSPIPSIGRDAGLFAVGCGKGKESGRETWGFLPFPNHGQSEEGLSLEMCVTGHHSCWRAKFTCHLYVTLWIPGWRSSKMFYTLFRRSSLNVSI
ncbi:Hypothetical predicted protein [Podarcis lilfordi]|uniref:Uncharacterized protein n=1 Tax=Podarcis lilfordi TaxID=74358 RepID=A0AA35KFK5_9SAUR|nr:Hypothetical predicted protein [Podarcis lilfordi]